MNILSSIRFPGLAAALLLALNVHTAARADSFVSSASSAGSASSGSVSDSFGGSSDSSKNDRKTADGSYRVIQIAATPGRDGFARVTMEAEQLAQEQRAPIVLDLPKASFDKQGLGEGDLVAVKNRVYGIEFARNDTRQAFFLVLADDWYGEMASVPVTL